MRRVRRPVAGGRPMTGERFVWALVAVTVAYFGAHIVAWGIS